jgi:uncharacterized cofD-like protein
MELARRGLQVTRIAPPWDSGGSSKPIRERLNMLSVGDIRNALMALAHGEGRAGHVVKVFNTRLSDSAEHAALERELGFYRDGLHPALQAMEPGLRGSIIGYLGQFIAAAGAGFDLRRGSLGNFVLAGAYLAHGNDINAAISMFRSLCSIGGDVWPTSSANDLHLHALLNDGEPVHGQDRITALDDARARIGIREIRLVRAGGGAAQANEPVLSALARADAIVFGPGSFYTSVLPHVLIGGIAQLLAARTGVPKILVGNMLECPETVGLSLNRMLEVFLAHARLTHVLANQSPTPFPRSVGGRRYIAFDANDPLLRRHGVEVVSRDFEDPWQRGIHEPAALVAATLAQLGAG